MVGASFVVVSAMSRVGVMGVYADGNVHPKFFLTRHCLTLFRGKVQVAFVNRATAYSVQVWFVASKTDQKREECTTTRTRLANNGEPGGGVRWEPSKSCWIFSLCTRCSLGGPL